MYIKGIDILELENYYKLKRAAGDRNRWHGLVVNLSQETTLR